MPKVRLDAGWVLRVMVALAVNCALANHASAVPGGLGCDYNGNGVCDAADYVVWRNFFGTNANLPNDSTPGTVDQHDYTVWKKGFGDMAGSGSVALAVTGQALPEPMSAAIFVSGAMLMLAGRRRR